MVERAPFRFELRGSAQAYDDACRLAREQDRARRAAAAAPAESMLEVWSAEDRTAWASAGTMTRRRALEHRWVLRASPHPEAVPVPACPVARMLHGYESAYRRLSECRGVVRDD